MVNLPEDIMLDICVRLPVKSIGRFRCVNKTWYNLLNDRKFVRKHLEHATEMNRIILMLHSWKNDQDHIYTIDYDPTSSTCTGRVNTNLPFVEDDDLQCFGCCNGLVCVSPYDRDILRIWNPSTNVYKQLPKAPILDAPVTAPNQDYSLIDIQCGFCYDYEIGEFKVICLASYADDSGDEVLGSDVYLYTSGSNTWITLDSISHHAIGERNQVPVNGVIYWEAYREYDEASRRVILSFYFEKEIFEEIPWPELLSVDFRTNMCVLRGSFCICGFDPDIGVEVLELKECEGRKSWNKLFTIDMKKHFGLVKDFVPLHFLRNGEFLFGFDTDFGFHVHQYDPKHETPRLLFVYEDSEEYSLSTTVYTDSLVSPNMDDNDNDNDADSDDDVEVVDDEEDNNTVGTIKKIKRV